MISYYYISYMLSHIAVNSYTWILFSCEARFNTDYYR